MFVEVQVTYFHIASAKLLKLGEESEVKRRSRGTSPIIFMSLLLRHFTPSPYLTRCLGNKIMQ